ncbi:MAG: deaminase [Rubrivivax sp.]
MPARDHRPLAHGRLRRRLLGGLCAWPWVARADARGRELADAAAAMKARALAWGDQPYGAVLVLDGRIVGEGPSRVVIDRDPDAHAERVAIRDAQRRLGRASLAGSVLVSTSIPCAACQRAAAAAGVVRLRVGPDADDAGAPRP